MVNTVVVLLWLLIGATVCQAACNNNGICENGETKADCAGDCLYDISPTHPRMFFSQSDVNNLRLHLNVSTSVHLNLTYAVQDCLGKALSYKNRYPNRTSITTMVNTLSFRYGEAPMYWALAGMLTGDQSYIDLCKIMVDVLLTIPINFGDDYNQGSKIESLGFIYDWLYPSLNTTTRAAIRNEIRLQVNGSALLPSLLNPTFTGGHAKSIHSRTLFGMLSIYGDGVDINNVLKLNVDNWIKPGGFVDTYEYLGEDGGHFFGYAYGESYREPSSEIMWDLSTNEPKWTKPAMNNITRYYLYARRNGFSATDEKWPLIGDTFQVGGEYARTMSWLIKQFSNPYQLWYEINLAASSSVSRGIWSLFGSILPLITDESGNGHHAVRQNVKWVPDGGVDGSGAYQCVNPSKTSANISIPTLVPSKFPQTAGTISFWVKMNISEQCCNSALFDNFDGNRNHLFLRNIVSGKYIQVGAQTAGSASYAAVLDIGMPDNYTNVWTMITVTYVYNNTTKVMKGYRNGEFMKQSDINNMTLRDQAVSFAHNLIGFIDEVNIYTTALNDSEIGRLYSRQPPTANRLVGLSFNTDASIPQPVQAPNDLPKSAVFPRSGYAFLRSGWDYDDLVHVTLHNPPYWAENHQHRDFNSFVVYYKKPLLIDSGNYEPPGYGSSHWINYYVRTVAHNSILVMDPSENFGNGISNDGGQYSAYSYPPLAEIKPGGRNARDGIKLFTETSDWTYVRGEATQAYASSKMKHFTRDMLFLRDFNDKYPVLIVYDRVESTNPDFTKSFLLHTVNQPTVQGTEIDITNGDSRLHASVFAPASPVIQSVGGPGKEYWVNGVNYNITATPSQLTSESGNWRLEIQPSQNNTHDNFFVVMDISELSSTVFSGISQKVYVNASIFEGVVLNEVAVVLFNKYNETEGLSDVIFGDFVNVDRVLITGLKPLTSYDVVMDPSSITIAAGVSHTADASGVVSIGGSNPSTTTATTTEPEISSSTLTVMCLGLPVLVLLLLFI